MRQNQTSMKCITIATDVSSDSKNKITTWACYIRHSGGLIQHVAQFDKYYNKTSHAETYALVNALVIAERNIPKWTESRVIIYNEIDYVLEPIKTKAGNVKLRDQDRTDAIMQLAMPILDRAKTWEKRDIKAHFSGWKESSRRNAYYMNRWCDKEARSLMKYTRRQMKKDACA